MRVRSIKDVLSGLIFIAIGAVFAAMAAGYEIGTALRMGPGYFPLVLAGALILLGGLVVAKGLSPATSADDAIVLPSWRGVVLILGAIAFFGATVRGLGLAPALAVAAFASALASPANSILAAVLLAVGMTTACVLIFIVGLGVPIRLVGPWLGG